MATPCAWGQEAEFIARMPGMEVQNRPSGVSSPCYDTEKHMTATQESISMAVFCDFENVALGVRDANYQRFDIKPVLELLLVKGSIVVKKAYCDWERYREFKAIMHEANFELIEIPHRSEERRVGKECRRLRPGAYAKRT